MGRRAPRSQVEEAGGPGTAQDVHWCGVFGRSTGVGRRFRYGYVLILAGARSALVQGPAHRRWGWLPSPVILRSRCGGGAQMDWGGRRGTCISVESPSVEVTMWVSAY